MREIESEKYTVTSSLCPMIYSFLLEELSFNEINIFFKDHPLIIDKQVLTGENLFNYLWNEQKRIPSWYINDLLNAVEPFFIKQGKNFSKQWSSFMIRFPLLDTKIAIWNLEAIISFFNKKTDYRDTLVEYYHLIHNKIAPGSMIKMVKRTESETGEIKALMVFANDISFSQNLIPFDFDSIFGLYVKNISKRLIGKPFDKFISNAECQTVFDKIDRKYHLQIRDSSFYIEGEKYGIAQTFHEYLKRNSIVLSELKPPDTQIVFIEKDYYCPERKRVVLKKGCIYGSPVYFFTLKFHKELKWERNPLTPLADELIFPEKSLLYKLRKKHQDFIKSLRPKTVVIYDPETVSISANYKHITSGIQAKLLQRILSLHIQLGRIDFERKQFASDPSFICSQENTGFSTRFDRMVKCLRKTCPQIGIVKTGRGKFKLDLKTDIELKEKSSG